MCTDGSYQDMQLIKQAHTQDYNGQITIDDATACNPFFNELSPINISKSCKYSASVVLAGRTHTSDSVQRSGFNAHLKLQDHVLQYLE